MKIQKTIKFKVGELSNSKQERLNLVLHKSLSCLKDIIQISIIENTFSNKKLHYLCYQNMREKYNLPACVIHQCRNKAVEMLKSWKKLQRIQKTNLLPPNPKTLRIKHTYSCSHCGYKANSDFVGSVNIGKKFFEFIQFEEQASINNALSTTYSEPEALKIRSVQNPIKKGGCSQ